MYEGNGWSLSVTGDVKQWQISAKSKKEPSKVNCFFKKKKYDSRKKKKVQPSLAQPSRSGIRIFKTANADSYCLTLIESPV